MAHLYIYSLIIVIIVIFFCKTKYIIKNIIILTIINNLNHTIQIIKLTFFLYFYLWLTIMKTHLVTDVCTTHNYFDLILRMQLQVLPNLYENLHYYYQHLRFFVINWIWIEFHLKYRYKNIFIWDLYPYCPELRGTTLNCG